MLSLVLHALRARRAQTLAMFALAVLAGLGSAAAPWFLGWGRDAVVLANLASSPVEERLVISSGSAQYVPEVGSPVALLRSRAEEYLAFSDGQIDFGARLLISGSPAAPDPAPPGTDEPDSPGEAESVDMYLISRDRICAQLSFVEGQCAGAGEVALSRDAAQRLGLGVGDPLTFDGVRLGDPATLRISGVYDVLDPYGAYWAGTRLLPSLAGDVRTPDPAVVTEETLLDLVPNSVEIDAHLVLPDSAFTNPGADLGGQLRRATSALRREGIETSSTTAPLIDRIARDQRLVGFGVTVGALQLIIVCWVGLFLAVRHTSEERRADIGLFKLRGTTTRRVWTLVGLYSGVPVLGGVLVGVVVGFAAAAGLAASSGSSGSVLSSLGDGGLLDIARTANVTAVESLWLSLAVAAVAGLGGLIAAVAAEWRGIRTPVVDLLRRVPARHRGWRADVTDLVVVAIALAGVYQARAEAGSGVSASVLAMLAPTLVGLAAALLVARMLPPLATRVGSSALRAGRAGVALAALQVARRQGTHRIFAVLAVAAAVFTGTAIQWSGATAAWSERAVQEVGADRVLLVDASSAGALLTAVRSVDPEGRYAMAVAVTEGARTSGRVVAVDATRYAQVGRLPAGLPSPADVAAALRPTVPQAPTFVDGALTLDVALAQAPSVPPAEPPATGSVGHEPAAAEVDLVLHLSTVEGSAVEVEYPALAEGRQSEQASVTGCAAGCRLDWIEVVVTPQVRLLGPVSVEIYEARQSGDTVLDGPTLGDITRWRTSLVESTVPPYLGARDGRLAITLPGGELPAGHGLDARVMPITAPVPLPVLIAGTIAAQEGESRVQVLGATDVPYLSVGTMPAVPRLGARGVLMDLEYALNSNDRASEFVDLSVWLTADAPDSLVAALVDRGVTVIEEESVADRASDLATYGPGLALRFEFFSVLVVLLLAAGVAVVGSTVERSGRVAELVALRGQGLRARAARVAGLAGTAVVVVAAVATGVLAALLARRLVGAGLPVFADDWVLLPLPDGLTPLTLLVAVAVVLVVIGVAALWGAARLVAAVAAGTSGATGTATRGAGEDRTGSPAERASRASGPAAGSS